MADSPFPADDLEGVARADRFFSALATGAPVRPADRVDDELARLLEGWRDDVRHTPTTPGTTVTAADAIAALESDFGTRGLPAATRRPRVALRVLGSVAAALLVAGGVTVAVFGLGSDSGGGPTASDDQVVLAAQTELRQVEELINTGRWDQAQERLDRLDSTVQTVSDPQARLTLDAWTTAYGQSISERRPAMPLPPTPAQAPPPGVTIVVPPSSASTSTEATSTDPTSTGPTSAEASTDATSTEATSSAVPTSTGATTPAPPAVTPPQTSAPQTSAPQTSAPPTAPPPTAPPTIAPPQATEPETTPVAPGPPPGPAPGGPESEASAPVIPAPAIPAPDVPAPVAPGSAPEVTVPAVDAPGGVPADVPAGAPAEAAAPVPETTTVAPAPAPLFPGLQLPGFPITP